MYKITATIHKEGGSLVRWEYYSEHRMGKKMCRQALKVMCGWQHLRLPCRAGELSLQRGQAEIKINRADTM